MKGCGRAVLIGVVGLAAIGAALCAGILALPRQPEPGQSGPRQTANVPGKDGVTISVGFVDVRLASAIDAAVPLADGASSPVQFICRLVLTNRGLGAVRYSRFSLHKAQLVDDHGRTFDADRMESPAPKDDQAGDHPVGKPWTAIVAFPKLADDVRTYWIRLDGAALGRPGETLEWKQTRDGH